MGAGLNGGRLPKTREQRISSFWDRVDQSYDTAINNGNSCWLWTGSKCIADGRGEYDFDGKRKMKAHRISWVLANGPIPDGKDVLHKCDIPLCVKPSHLFLGTHQENMRDKGRKNRSSGFCHRKSAKSASDLTKEEVLTMRAEYTGEHGNVCRLAEKYGLKPPAVSSIIQRKCWKDV